MIRVVTKHAEYLVDRENRQWMRHTHTHPLQGDDTWIPGGFTLAEVGGRAYAQYENGRASDGAPGRWTGPITSIEEE